jgi:transposase
VLTRPELTSRQAEIVDILKEQCPDFAVMRKLTFGFRSILCRGGKVTTLHRWLQEARETGIHSLRRFVRTVKQDLSAVESAVTERWRNGVELLRARVLPLPVLEIE